MNPEKLAKLQNNVRIGGKGSVRRKKKVQHKNATADDKKLQQTLKKQGCQPIPGIEEVNLFKAGGAVTHFENPKVQAAIGSNVFVVNGQSKETDVGSLLPGIMHQLGPENVQMMQQMAEAMKNGDIDMDKMAAQLGVSAPSSGVNEIDEDDDEDLPELVGNFDEAANKKN